MKLKACSLFASLFFALGSPVFSADIPITGPNIVNGSEEFTFYATPPTPIAPGTTYTWQVGGGTIVAQNTDPAAGPLYVTIDWPPVLMQDAIEITDNHGNSGIHWVEVWGWGIAVKKNPFDTTELHKDGVQLQATCRYERHEAVSPGDKKRALKRQAAIV